VCGHGRVQLAYRVENLTGNGNRLQNKRLQSHAVCESVYRADDKCKQEGQHPLTGQRAANFRLLANQ